MDEGLIWKMLFSTASYIYFKYFAEEEEVEEMGKQEA